MGSQKDLNSCNLTWGCAQELESRLRKTLFCADENCYSAMPSAMLTDVAVSMYLSAAPSPKRKLQPSYASSLSRKVNVMPCTLMMAIMYLERLRQTNPDYLQRVSSSDLFVVSMLVASKYLIDDGEEDEIFNDQWAEAGGLAVSTINKLEREFLTALDWRVYVKPDNFLRFCTSLEATIALKYGLKRGWFSYTDLTVFLALVHYKETLTLIMKNAVKIIFGCTVLYGLTVATLVSCASFMTSSRGYQSAEGRVNSYGLSLNADPYSNRMITRQRVRTYAIKTCNDTLDTPTEDIDEHEYIRDGLNLTSDDMREQHCKALGIGNMIAPCSSIRRITEPRVEDTKTMSLMFSWPHCLQRRFSFGPKMVWQKHQFKLGHLELVSLFNLKMLTFGLSLSSSTSSDSFLTESSKRGWTIAA